jgi:hypothetical protein
MTQGVILPIVVALLVIHDLYYMPLTAFIITAIVAAALYGITRSLLLPAAVLFIAPIIQMLLQIMKKTEKFQGAIAVSERVKEMKAAKVVAKPPSTTGVLASANIENFQSVDASGSEAPTGLSGVSVPAYVREKGRMIVIPEHSMARLESFDNNPRPSPALIMGEDDDSVGTALKQDATQLSAADQKASAQSMSTGPTDVSK